MLRQMSVPFPLMTPFNETTCLSGLLSCFLSALQFQSWAIGAKAKKRQKRQPLLHFILICKKKVKGFSEIIKINKKINKKKRSRHKNYSWIIIIEYTFLDF